MSHEYDRWRRPKQPSAEGLTPGPFPIPFSKEEGETKAKGLSPSPFPVPFSREEGENDLQPLRFEETAKAPAAVLDPILRLEGVCRDYAMGDAVVHALKATTFAIEQGQFVAIRGRSGSGKTTLLHLIGGLDQPTAGRIWVDGAEVTGRPERELVSLRRNTIGFIFQAFGLIPILTAAENVQVPLRLANAEVPEREARVRLLLDLVGLAERGGHRPHELSGGEQQRVAIARALANDPKLLLADEPTGQLDSRTARSIMELIHALVRDGAITALVATHDPILIDLADRVIELRDGAIVADSLVHTMSYR